MQVVKLTPKALSEKELQNVISLQPELIAKGSKTVAQEYVLEKGRIDLILVNGSTLQIVELKVREQSFESIAQSAYYYTLVKKHFEEIKSKLGLSKVQDIEVVIIMPQFPDWYLEIVKLFGENYPLKLYSYEAFETDKKGISLLLNEVPYKSQTSFSNPKAVQMKEKKSTSDNTPIDGSQKIICTKFVDGVKSTVGNKVTIVEKGWGYSIKSGRTVVLTLTYRKKDVKIEAYDSGKWVNDILCNENIGYYLKCLEDTISSESA